MTLTAGVDLSIRVIPNASQVNAFGLPHVSSAPFEAGDFIGDTTKGGAVNCRVLQIAPHGNGTHTETISHIVDEMFGVCDVVPLQPFSVAVVSVAVEQLDGSADTYTEGEGADWIIPRFDVPSGVEGLIVRTIPNSDQKKTETYSNPPYLSEDAMATIAASEIVHLLVDVPSVDRSEDEGRLRNHRTFWNVALGSTDIDEASRLDRTITEMVFVPDVVLDGRYTAWISVPAVETDAMLSRVVVFPNR